MPLLKRRSAAQFWKTTGNSEFCNLRELLTQSPMPSQPWTLLPQVEPSPALRAAVGGHPLVAQLLAQREIDTPERALPFLDSAAYSPAPPNALVGLERAAHALFDAICEGKNFLVWGGFRCGRPDQHDSAGCGPARVVRAATGPLSCAQPLQRGPRYTTLEAARVVGRCEFRAARAADLRHRHRRR